MVFFQNTLIHKVSNHWTRLTRNVSKAFAIFLNKFMKAFGFIFIVLYLFWKSCRIEIWIIVVNFELWEIQNLIYRHINHRKLKRVARSNILKYIIAF